MASITVIGTGYVGLVTGAGFAQLGHDVIGVDVNPSKIDALNRGEIPIFEQGLEDLVVRNMRAGRLSFQLHHDETSLASEIFYLCVPTPQGPDGAADLRFLEEAAIQIGPHIPRDAIVVNKSTVPVGSARFVEQVIGRSDIHVVSNPEFLREGSAVADFMKPDRIVIGSDDQAACVRIAALYLSLGANILVTDAASAELIKYASNAFLATKLSFINSIAAVCEGVGADINHVRLGMGYDTRIGPDFLMPGPGWGGSCFPKDSHAMLRISQDAGYEFEVLQAAINANEAQFDRIVEKIEAACDGEVRGKQIGILGLAFKAGTDDTRMSPAIAIGQRLIERGASLVGFDPVAELEMDGLTQVGDAYAAFDGSVCVAVLTEWNEFKWLDLDKASQAMDGEIVIDARGIVDSGAAIQAGLDLVSIGRS